MADSDPPDSDPFGIGAQNGGQNGGGGAGPAPSTVVIPNPAGRRARRPADAAPSAPAYGLSEGGSGRPGVNPLVDAAARSGRLVSTWNVCCVAPFIASNTRAMK